MNTNSKHVNLLRLLLICAGFGWAISAFGVVMPWSFVVSQLQGLGAKDLPSDPMLNYWLRMTAGAFMFIGVLFFAAAFNPVKYLWLIRWLGWFLVCEGIILLASGIVLQLFLIPYAIDSAFCLLIGCGLLILSGMIKGARYETQHLSNSGICPVCGKSVILKDQKSLLKNRIKVPWFCTYEDILLSIEKGEGEDSCSDRKHIHWACNECICAGEAILADSTIQKFCDCYPYLAFFDEHRKCQECGTMYIFNKNEQQYWYEKLKFWVQSRPKYCKDCYKKRHPERGLTSE